LLVIDKFSTVIKVESCILQGENQNPHPNTQNGTMLLNCKCYIMSIVNVSQKLSSGDGH